MHSQMRPSNIPKRSVRRLFRFDLPERLFELEREQDCSKGHGDHVGDRLGKIDAHGGVARYKMRHDVDQGEQQHEFTHDRHDDRRGRMLRLLRQNYPRKVKITPGRTLKWVRQNLFSSFCA